MKTYPKTIPTGERFDPRILSACLSLLLSAAIVGCGKKEEARKADAPEVVEQQAGEEVQPKSTKGDIRSTLPASESDVRLVAAPDEAVERVVPTEAASDKPFVIEDLAQIKVHDGIEGPKVGDTIYTFKNLPKEACGTYWVMDSDGYVAMLAVCSGDHAH